MRSFCAGRDFVYADYYHFSELDEKTGEPLDARHIKLPPVLRPEKGNAVGACFLYTRAAYEAVGLYDPELFLVEDYDYFIRIQKRFRAEHIAEPLYYFRRHDEALYCSRYAEVKAADVLVRCKNGLLDNEAAADVCAELVTRDVGGLRNPLLRGAYAFVRKVSFRLTKQYEKLSEDTMEDQASVSKVLEGFVSKSLPFVKRRCLARNHAAGGDARIQVVAP